MRWGFGLGSAASAVPARGSCSSGGVPGEHRPLLERYGLEGIEPSEGENMKNLTGHLVVIRLTDGRVVELPPAGPPIGKPHPYAVDRPAGEVLDGVPVVERHHVPPTLPEGPALVPFSLLQALAAEGRYPEDLYSADAASSAIREDGKVVAYRQLVKLGPKRAARQHWHNWTGHALVLSQPNGEYAIVPADDHPPLSQFPRPFTASSTWGDAEVSVAGSCIEVEGLPPLEWGSGNRYVLPASIAVLVPYRADVFVYSDGRILASPAWSLEVDSLL
jgi:hypothetical protein